MTHTLLLIQWPVPPGEGWSAGYNGLDRSVALGRSVNGSLHKQQLNLATCSTSTGTVQPYYVVLVLVLVRL